MRRAVLLLTTMALAIVLASGVAQAIINGEPDTGPNAHPYVGAYVVKVEGELRPVCSGTLISARVFLTAGHCTEIEVANGRPVYVSFDPTYKPGASKLIRGTPYLHPKYCPAATKVGCVRTPIVSQVVGYFRYDVGVVILEEPVRMATYGALPEAGLVETLKEGQRLTVVGYGVNGFERGGDGPRPRAVYPDARYRGTVRLLNTKDPKLDDMFVKTTGPPHNGRGRGFLRRRFWRTAVHARPAAHRGSCLIWYIRRPVQGTGLLPTDGPTGGLKVGPLVPLIF